MALAAGLPFAIHAGRPNDPAVDIAALVETTAGPARAAYRSGGASLLVMADRGWTLSVYTGAAPRYQADFLVVRRKDGVLSVDLITDPRARSRIATGPMPELNLAGQAALDYLARLELVVAPFDALVGRLDVARADPLPVTSQR